MNNKFVQHRNKSFLVKRSSFFTFFRQSAVLSPSSSVFCLLVICLLSSVLCHPSSALAASTGISISPVVQNVTLPHSQPQLGTTIDLTNNTSTTISLAVRSVDFNSLDENGGVLFSGSQGKSLNSRFGLSKVMTLDPAELTLEPGQTQKIHVLVNNSDGLAPGGHYGAVLVRLTGAQPKTGQSVNFNQEVSSLIFLSKTGGETYLLSLDKPKLGLYWSTLPSHLNLRFYAGGNEYVIPRGTITITNPFGKVAASGVINDSSGIVLPQTHRRFDVQLTRGTASLFPGIYTVRINYRFDGTNNYTSVRYTFVVLNLFGVIVLIALAALLIWAIWKRKVIKSLVIPRSRRGQAPVKERDR